MSSIIFKIGGYLCRWHIHILLTSYYNMMAVINKCIGFLGFFYDLYNNIAWSFSYLAQSI